MGKAGWNWLFNSRKWHFFDEDGRSLCGRFMTLGSNADAETIDRFGSTDNCGRCERKRRDIVVSELRKGSRYDAT